MNFTYSSWRTNYKIIFFFELRSFVICQADPKKKKEKKKKGYVLQEAVIVLW